MLYNYRVMEKQYVKISIYSGLYTLMYYLGRTLETIIARRK